MHDVQQEQYATVIRDLIKHENDVTNHRIMWLLIGQGFIANAYVSAEHKGASTKVLLAFGGILVSLSAFVMLYGSYRARGYLLFVGKQAKQGTLQEEHLPRMGWPRMRIRGWWRDVWVCPWVRQASDLLEPWVFLPCVFMLMWLAALLQQWTMLDIRAVLMLAALLSATMVAVFCIVLVWSQGRGAAHSRARLRRLTVTGIDE